MGGKRELGSDGGKGGELIPHPPPKIDLRDAHAIRRELGSVYRAMRSGQIPTQDGTRLAYVLDLLRRAVETSDLQNRIELIERQFEGASHARQH